MPHLQSAVPHSDFLLVSPALLVSAVHLVFPVLPVSVAHSASPALPVSAVHLVSPVLPVPVAHLAFPAVPVSAVHSVSLALPVLVLEHFHLAVQVLFILFLDYPSSLLFLPPDVFPLPPEQLQVLAVLLPALSG